MSTKAFITSATTVAVRYIRRYMCESEKFMQACSSYHCVCFRASSQFFRWRRSHRTKTVRYKMLTEQSLLCINICLFVSQK